MNDEKIDYKGCSIQIVREETPSNPRTEWDNLSTMVCFHKKYNLGDEEHGYNQDNYSSWDELEKAIIKQEGDLVILPLYLYDHGGITIRTSPFECKWDSGQIGFVFISKAKIRHEYSVKRISDKVMKKVIELINAEVKTYDDYLTGEVYGYVVKKDGEHIASCFGFYGYEETKEDSYMMKQAMEEADDFLAKVKSH